MLSPSVIENLEKMEKDQVLVVVEGEKDFLALKKFGFKKIVKIGGKPLERVVEEVVSSNPSEVAILTDFDPEGESMASYLTEMISRYKIKVNHLVRCKFKSFKIHKIEELNSITKLIGDDSNGKISSIYCKIFNRSRIQSRRYSGKTRCHRSYIRSNRRFVGSRFRFEGTSKNR